MFGLRCAPLALTPILPTHTNTPTPTHSKHAALAQQPVLEPPTPVDPANVKKYQAESKRKITSFFSKVSVSDHSAAAAAALAPAQEQQSAAKKGKG